jgi:hypothetical protein
MKRCRFGLNDAVLDKTTPFWTKRMISFKRKWCQKHVRVQISPQFVICSIKSLIAILILKINSIASLPNSIVSPEVGQHFRFSSWSLIYAI